MRPTEGLPESFMSVTLPTQKTFRKKESIFGTIYVYDIKTANRYLKPSHNKA
jgi:hypothetical protein